MKNTAKKFFFVHKRFIDLFAEVYRQINKNYKNIYLAVKNFEETFPWLGMFDGREGFIRFDVSIVFYFSFKGFFEKYDWLTIFSCFFFFLLLFLQVVLCDFYLV